jgi:hypothetical protein
MTSMAKAAVALALLLNARPALAQQTTGSIAGRVVDDQDAGIAGVTVTASSSGTGLTREVASDANGLYRVMFVSVWCL